MPGLARILKKLQGEYLGDLSRRDKEALRVYSRQGADLNRDLRGTGIPHDEPDYENWLDTLIASPSARAFNSTEELAARLDAIIERAPRLDEPIDVYRQVEDFYTPEGDLDPAFLSTRATVKAASDSGDADSAELRRLLEISIEPDDSYLFLPAGITNHPYELEVLAPRNRRLKSLGSSDQKSEGQGSLQEFIKRYRLTRQQGGHVTKDENYATR